MGTGSSFFSLSLFPVPPLFLLFLTFFYPFFALLRINLGAEDSDLHVQGDSAIGIDGEGSVGLAGS